MKTPETETLYVRIPSWVKEALIREANSEGRTITNQVSEILRDRYNDARTA